MKKYILIFTAVILLCSALPIEALAGGETASELVVVADTRVIPDRGLYHSFIRYIADTYNSNILVFAVWCTVLTALYGALLGVIMDFAMSHTGLDLENRSIVEH